MTKAVEDYKFAIVMKILRVQPSINVIRLNVVKKRGLVEIPTISFMNDYHVLIQMKNERDFVHGWAREGRVMKGYSFRLFKWTKDFDLHNQKDVRDEEYEEVWYDKENDVVSETLQLKGKEFFDVPKNLVNETDDIIVENRLLGNLAM
ncbi:hypothetical protein ACLOJK_030358 [Asimina triloba]